MIDHIYTCNQAEKPGKPMAVKVKIPFTPVIDPLHPSATLPAIIVPKLLRIQDAARYLSATTCFVATMLREGKIPSLILGKRRVVDVDDLDAWIKERKGTGGIAKT
jgi:excisionase family DNA binding protein